ncbi:MAG: alpha/beta fold hydrolase [Acidimicrobiales bacterium]
MVLVHGFTQTGASWRPIANLLSDSHEVLMPDLPGHGSSPIAAGTLDMAAAQLGEACGKGTYVGYSLGGRTCLHLALDRSDLVERLVLVSTTAGIEDAEEREARLESDGAMAARIEQGGAEGLVTFVDEWLASPLFAHLSEEQADRAARTSNTPEGLASSLRHHGTGAQLPLWETVRELTMPVLVIAGEDDPKFVEIGERLADAIGANALFLLVPRTGHAVPFEQPDAFARLIAEFIAGKVGPAAADTGT